MLNEKRLIRNFINMVKIYSPSLREKGIVDYIIHYFNEKNIEFFVDDSHMNLNGDTGNLIIKIKGESNGEPICFCAHMDQVEPCENVNPIIDGNIIKSDGTTTLGGDDKAGIAVILEAISHIIEENIKCKDIYLLFTISEETGLKGAKNFNKDNLPCNDIVIIDACGKAGIIAYKAPSQELITMTFLGKKAHAGIEPENGINAVVVAANAISMMNIGRIDEVTTSNIGKIYGGDATNVVTDKVTFNAEIRSHNIKTLEFQINHMKKCCDESAKKYSAKVEFLNERAFNSFLLPLDSKVCKLMDKAIRSVGIEPEYMVIGGGSDANVFSELGYNCAITSMGVFNAHTVNEYVEIDQMVKAVEIVVNMMTNS